MTRLEQLVGRRCVRSSKRRLKIRALEVCVATVDTDPRECINDALGPLWLVARLVGVFNTQNESAVVLQSKNPVVKGGSRTPYVEVARR